MSNEKSRAEISAILDEIEELERALPAELRVRDPEEVQEALEVIMRLERKLNGRGNVGTDTNGGGDQGTNLD